MIYSKVHMIIVLLKHWFWILKNYACGITWPKELFGMVEHGFGKLKMLWLGSPMPSTGQCGIVLDSTGQFGRVLDSTGQCGIVLDSTGQHGSGQQKPAWSMGLGVFDRLELGTYKLLKRNRNDFVHCSKLKLNMFVHRHGASPY